MLKKIILFHLRKKSEQPIFSTAAPGEILWYKNHENSSQNQYKYWTNDHQNQNTSITIEKSDLLTIRDIQGRNESLTESDNDPHRSSSTRRYRFYVYSHLFTHTLVKVWNVKQCPGRPLVCPTITELVRNVSAFDEKKGKCRRNLCQKIVYNLKSIILIFKMWKFFDSCRNLVKLRRVSKSTLYFILFF